ncbi:uncharacterized protein TNCV_2235291 [Trichonephila clavipes]|nr:uncharacterized protein TNCV_2235291 [Trichonephila clavipes]
MEVDGMKEIFERLVPQRNTKYIKYIGDGDTKTFPELQRTAPYSIEKVECVCHIQKRMGARLRKLKTMNRGKKLSDGKSMSGKNRLTDKFIDTITSYYGNDIRQNNSSVSDMRQAIWAIYCHYRSTDEELMHHFCRIGDTSWCKYQKAVATNSTFLFKHKNIVPIAIMDEIKPIIAELSAPKLLKKCVWGGPIGIEIIEADCCTVGSRFEPGEGLDLQTTVLGKCSSSPEDEQEKRERAATGKERLYPLHKGHRKGHRKALEAVTQVAASKARQGRLKNPGSLVLKR